MPRPRIVPLLAVVIAIAALALTTHGAAPTLGKTPVVVELFTSQGCSSCPPADALIHEIASDPALRGKVIPLAFHVDYWDSLGWRDPFSSAEWTQRQARYARAMQLASSYTPQAVVNGTSQFVGSNRSALNNALESASNGKPAGELSVSARREGNTIVASVHAASSAKDDVLLALTEDGVTTKIEHGENAGRTLVNDAVVRRLIRVKPGQTTVSIPVDASWRKLTVTAFAQSASNLNIEGAATSQVQ
jgi:hypothetical protein